MSAEFTDWRLFAYRAFCTLKRELRGGIKDLAPLPTIRQFLVDRLDHFSDRASFLFHSRAV
jgi:hypothetical protein